MNNRGQKEKHAQGMRSMGAFGAFPQGPEPESEQPTMRAVALMDNGPQLARFGGDVGIMKPIPLGISRPSAGLCRKQPSFTVTKEWTATAPSSIWDVKGEDLIPVPVDYPLERSHREIVCDASKVAHRITEVLSTMSIEAEYDAEKAKAKCKTMDLVKFRIRLYSAGENGQPVVVEVQRRSGSSKSFIRTCRAVLDAAEGGEIRTSLSIKKLPSMSGMQCLASASMKLKTNPEEAAHDVLITTANLFQTKKRDSELLGLQNLQNLTDPVKTSAQIAVLVSKKVVCLNELDIRSSVFALMKQEHLDEEDDPSQLVVQQRHMAFVVFANCLENCSKDASLEDACREDFLTVELLPVLLNCVRSAPDYASDAYFAALCLSSLISCCHATKISVIEAGGMSLLEAAHEYGKEFHDLLSKETSRCIELLR